MRRGNICINSSIAEIYTGFVTSSCLLPIPKPVQVLLEYQMQPNCSERTVAKQLDYLSRDQRFSDEGRLPASLIFLKYCESKSPLVDGEKSVALN